MVKKKQVGRKVEGWKAKTWYKVYVPEIFGKSYIGDTISADPENMMGRVMETTLGEITQDFGKQHIKLRIRVANVTADAAYTDFLGHEVTRDYLRSMVKRRTSRIDMVTPVTTKDGKKMQLTTTCFTLSRANMSQVHAIRLAMGQYITTHATEVELNTLIKEIVAGDLSRELLKIIKLIYPVRRVEVIKSSVEQPKVEVAVTA